MRLMAISPAGVRFWPVRSSSRDYDPSSPGESQGRRGWESLSERAMDGRSVGH